MQQQKKQTEGYRFVDRQVGAGLRKQSINKGNKQGRGKEWISYSEETHGHFSVNHLGMSPVELCTQFPPPHHVHLMHTHGRWQGDRRKNAC